MYIDPSLEKIADVAKTKATRKIPQNFALSILAGAFIAIGAAALLLVKADTNLSFAISSLLAGLAFSIGLFAIVNTGTELFTGDNLMITGVILGNIKFSQMFKTWITVWIGNFIGAAIIAVFLTAAEYGALSNGAVTTAATNIATAKCSMSIATITVRAIMCNILVCCAVYIATISKTVTEKFFATLMPVTIFVACGYEHCIANMFFLPFAILNNAPISMQDIAKNIGAATIGNIIGGTLLFTTILILGKISNILEPNINEKHTN